MIPHVEIGAGYRGCLDYLYDTGGTKGKITEYICGTAVGDNAAEISQEMASTRSLRPSLTRSVAHFSLSLSPVDGRLNQEKWESIAEQFLVLVGFDPTKTVYTVVRHGETDHDHIHIAASRIMLDGVAWPDGKCNLRAQVACRKLEQIYGLTPVNDAKPGKKMGINKIEKARAKAAKAAGKPVPADKLWLQNVLDEALKERVTAPDFMAKLASKGVLTRANVASTGRLNGFSFSAAGMAYKGSDLGLEYNLAGLIHKGLIYDPERHAESLRASNAAVIGAKPTIETDTKPDLIPPKIDAKEVAKRILRGKIDAALRGAVPHDAAGFVGRLMDQGLKVSASLAGNGRLSGFRFGVAGAGGTETYKGSELGYDYTLAGLVRRGLHYDPATDQVALTAALARPPRAEASAEADPEWPDAISAGPDPAQGWGCRPGDFGRRVGLLWWRDQATDDLVFFARGDGPKNERQGVAFVDRGKKIDVRVANEDNILRALQWGAEKWGTVRIVGSPEFVAWAESIAQANGIPLAANEPASAPISQVGPAADAGPVAPISPAAGDQVEADRRPGQAPSRQTHSSPAGGEEDEKQQTPRPVQRPLFKMTM